jgi:MFS family permease
MTGQAISSSHTPSHSPNRAGFAAALRSPAFTVLWLSEAVSLVGDRLLMIALMALVYERTQSAAAVGLLAMVKAIPALLLGTLAGVFVDRWPRKATMVLSNLIQGALVLLIPFTDALPAIFAIYLGMAVVNQFFVPARSATIPSLVSAEALTAANSLFAMAFVGAIAIGPAIGSWIAVQFGLDVAFYADTATFLVPALGVSLLAIPETHRASSGHSLGADWREGLALARSRPDMRNSLALIAAVALLISSLSVAGVMLAEQNLGGANNFGFLMSATGLGMLTGAAAANKLSQRFDRQRLGAVGAIVAGLAGCALPWAKGPFLGLAAIFLGLGFVTVQVSAQTTLQTAPEQLRGRMLGLSQAMMGSVTFLMAALAGMVAERAGVAALMVGVGLVAVIAGCMASGFSQQS